MRRVNLKRTGRLNYEGRRIIYSYRQGLKKRIEDKKNEKNFEHFFFPIVHRCLCMK